MYHYKQRDAIERGKWFNVEPIKPSKHLKQSETTILLFEKGLDLGGEVLGLRGKKGCQTLKTLQTFQKILRLWAEACV